MNKNTLNAQRLLRYFRKDWSENNMQLYYYFIIPYGIMTLLFSWMDFSKPHSVVVALDKCGKAWKTTTTVINKSWKMRCREKTTVGHSLP